MSNASGSRIRLANSERPRLSASNFLRRADPTEALALNIILRRRAGAPKFPDPIHWMHTPPIKRRYPSHKEFAATYGATGEDIAQAESFAQRHGFKIIQSSAARRSVIVAGTVAMAERAFGIELGRYKIGEDTHRGHDGPVYIEAEAASIVEAVLGLDNRRLGRHAGGGGSGAMTFTPTQVAQAYSFWPNRGGDGETIGIIEFTGGFAVGDVEQYVASATGLKAYHAQIVTALGTNPGANGNTSAGNSDFEVLLDIDVALSVAPNARIALYFGSAPPMFSEGYPTELGWSAVLQAVLDDITNKPKVLTISWSAAERIWPAGAITQISALFAEATSMHGITIFASSADWGASGFQSDAPGENALQNVHYPASDPNVTGCGGTHVVSLAPLQQETWNDASGATGGGISVVFTDDAAYPWQKNVTVNGVTVAGRGVPDIAGNASGLSGYDLIYQGQPVSEIVGQLFSGTSAVAPFYAAFIAVMNGFLKASFPGFQSIGLLNPTLYQLASTDPSIFYEINDGGNNTFNGVTGYQAGTTAGAGWNACTGLGSVNGLDLQVLLTLNQIPGNPGCAAIFDQFLKLFVQSIRGGSVSR
jgi:kumamolisin